MQRFGPATIIAIRELQDWAARAAGAIRAWPPVRITLGAQFVLGKVVDGGTWEVRWPADAEDPACALGHVELVSGHCSRVSDLDRLWHCQEVSAEMFSAAVQYCKKVLEGVERARAGMAELAELKAELDGLRLAGLVPTEPDVNELLYPVAHALLLARDGQYTPGAVGKLVGDLLGRATSAISNLTIALSDGCLHVAVGAGKVIIHLTIDERYDGRVYAYLSVPESKEIIAEINNEHVINAVASKLARLIHTPGEALLTKRIAQEVCSYQEGKWMG